MEKRRLTSLRSVLLQYLVRTALACLLVAVGWLLVLMLWVQNGGLFLPAYVDSEREQLVERIERVKNDKRSWAFQRLRENMCAYEDYATGAYGTADEAGSIHYVKLTKHYKELLAVSPMEIFYCGSRPGKEVAAYLSTSMPESTAIMPLSVSMLEKA